MKNILLSATFILTLLPQVSFGANQPTVPVTPVESPQVTACMQQVDALSSAFWTKQASDRSAFGQAHPDLAAKHQAHFQGMLAIDMARRQGKPTAGLPAPPPEDGTIAGFMSQQLSDKNAFLQKLAQDRANCLNPNGPINPS